MANPVLEEFSYFNNCTSTQFVKVRHKQFQGSKLQPAGRTENYNICRNIKPML